MAVKWDISIANHGVEKENYRSIFIVIMKISRGANTSTDQMVSPNGGLIPQVRGKLMKVKYYGATVFVDHFSDFTYVHLMKDATGESILEAKNAYERLMKLQS